MTDLDTLLAAARDGRLAGLIGVARAGGVRRLECGDVKLELGPTEDAGDAKGDRVEPTWTKDELFGASGYEPRES